MVWALGKSLGSVHILPYIPPLILIRILYSSSSAGRIPDNINPAVLGLYYPLFAHLKWMNAGKYFPVDQTIPKNSNSILSFLRIKIGQWWLSLLYRWARQLVASSPGLVLTVPQRTLSVKVNETQRLLWQKLKLDIFLPGYFSVGGHFRDNPGSCQRRGWYHDSWTGHIDWWPKLFSML